MKRILILALLLFATGSFAATDLLDDGLSVLDPNFTLSVVRDLGGGSTVCRRWTDGTVQPDPATVFSSFMCEHAGSADQFYVLGGGFDDVGNFYTMTRSLTAETMSLVQRTSAGVETAIMSVTGCGAASGGTRLLTRVSNITVNHEEGAIYMAVRAIQTTNCYAPTGVEQSGILKLTATQLKRLYSFTAIIVNLTAGDDAFEFAQAHKAMTLQDASCYCRGTCAPTIATMTFQDRAGNAIALASALTCGSGTAVSSYISFDTSDTDINLVAGEGLAFNVTNTPDPATDEYTVTVRWR